MSQPLPPPSPQQPPGTPHPIASRSRPHIPMAPRGPPSPCTWAWHPHDNQVPSPWQRHRFPPSPRQPDSPLTQASRHHSDEVSPPCAYSVPMATPQVPSFLWVPCPHGNQIPHPGIPSPWQRGFPPRGCPVPTATAQAPPSYPGALSPWQHSPERLVPMATVQMPVTRATPPGMPGSLSRPLPRK